MGRVTKVLLLLAVVVPVTAYVAGSLAPPGAPGPADHSPVILRDAATDRPTTDRPAPPPDERTQRTPRSAPPRDRPHPGTRRGDGQEARVVTPQPTPVGKDDDDGWDDDGSGDDEQDERDDGRHDDGDD